MVQKICPICDGKLKGNYCLTCRRFVRRPLEWDVRYYLNEPRPEGEEGDTPLPAPQSLGELFQKRPEIKSLLGGERPKKRAERSQTAQNNRNAAIIAAAVAAAVLIGLILMTLWSAQAGPTRENVTVQEETAVLGMEAGPEV